MPVLSDSAAEKAFYDTARSILLDRAPQLMKYELGFQTIDKNDTLTRIVGAAAFKVDDLWLFIPLFYLNGEIKGQDLLYIKNADLFVPLKDNWIDYVINKKSAFLGKAIDKAEADSFTAPNLWNLRLPTIGKYASEDYYPRFLDLIKESSDAALTLMESLKDNTSKTVLNDALSKFDINKIFEALKPYITSPLFKKQGETLTVEPTPEEKEYIVEYGVYINEPEAKSEIQLTETFQLTSNLQSGFYNVKDTSGNWRPCAIISKDNQYIIIDMNTGAMTTVNKDSQIVTGPEISVDKYKVEPSDVKVGKLYYFITTDNANRLNARVIKPKAIIKENNMITLQVNSDSLYSNNIYLSTRIDDLIFVKDKVYQSSPVGYSSKGIYSDPIILPIKNYTQDENDIKLETFTPMLVDILFKSAGVQSKIYTDGIEFYHTVGGDTSRPLTQKELIERLVRREGINIKKAYELIDKVKKDKQVRYFIKYAQGYPNMAYNVQAAAPMDAAMGAMPTDIQPQIPQTALKPEDVEMINQALQTGQTDILDTALLASLLKTQENAFIVDKYLDDILNAVDKLGRILFLYYWHYDKFKERYGEEDMPELEDNLRNTFKSLGDLYLFLKNKTAVSSLSKLEQGLT